MSLSPEAGCPAGEHAAGEPVELYSPAFFADPYAYYGRLRESEPAYWHPQHRTWILTRYADVNRVARDPTVFSSRLSALDALPPSPPVREQDVPLLAAIDAVHVEEFIQLDPPRHTAQRAAVSPRFAPRAVEPLRAMIRGVIDELFDAVADRGAMDVVADIAQPLPLLVISRIAGIPTGDTGLIADQARRRMAAVLSLDDDRLAIAADGFRSTSAYLGAELDRRAAGGCPVADDAREDVLADLVRAEQDGVYSRAASLANAMMIVDAGHETTIQLLANGTLLLMTHPEQWAAFRAAPEELAPTLVDECLRFDPPLHALRRIVTQDVELHGRTLHAGDRVLAVVASANRDPRRFPDPETFDLTRRPNTHLSLGAGTHFCLGQYLAKVEGQEYFRALARRVPDAVLPDPRAVTYNPVPRVRSITALPVEWAAQTGAVASKS